MSSEVDGSESDDEDESDGEYEADGEWDGILSRDRISGSGDEWMADPEDKGREDGAGEQRGTSGKQQGDTIDEQEGSTQEQQGPIDQKELNTLEEPDYSAGVTDEDGWVFLLGR